LLDIYILFKNELFIILVVYLIGKRNNLVLFSALLFLLRCPMHFISAFFFQLNIYQTSTSIVFVKSLALSTQMFSSWSMLIRPERKLCFLGKIRRGWADSSFRELN